MALDGETTTMQAVGANPGLLYRAPDYCNSGAEIVQGSNYLEGKAVRGTYPGQILMETPWLERGILNNIVQPTLYIEGNGAAGNKDYMKVIVHKRDPDSPDTEYEAKEIHIKYRPSISNTVGAMPLLNEYQRPASQFYWFDIRYEYKFIVQLGQVADGGSLDLEGLYLQYFPSTVTVGPRQERFGDSIVQAVPMVEGIDWSATSDGSGTIDTTLSIQKYDDSGADTGLQHGYFNNIEAVVTGFAFGSTLDTSTMIQTDAVASTDGGYAINPYIQGLAPNTVYYFYTIIIGHQNAVEV